MLRFMCFVGFAWPECKTKRHFILSKSFFPWPEVEQGMAKGVRCVSQPAIKKDSCAAYTAFSFKGLGIYV